MKQPFTTLLLIGVLTASVATLDSPQSARILSQTFNNDGTGLYNYSFESSDGTERREEGHLEYPNTDDESLIVHGSYSYTDADGQTYNVRYTADDNGFHPEGDHIKVPPFVPWIHKHDHSQQDDNDSPAVNYLPSTPLPPYAPSITPQPPYVPITTPQPPKLYIPSKPTTYKPPKLYIPSKPTTPQPPSVYIPSRPTFPPVFVPSTRPLSIVPTTLKPPRPTTVQINSELEENEEGYKSTPEPLKLTIFNTVRPLVNQQTSTVQGLDENNELVQFQGQSQQFQLQQNQIQGSINRNQLNVQGQVNINEAQDRNLVVPTQETNLPQNVQFQGQSQAVQRQQQQLPTLKQFLNLQNSQLQVQQGNQVKLVQNGQKQVVPTSQQFGGGQVQVQQNILPQNVQFQGQQQVKLVVPTQQPLLQLQNNQFQVQRGQNQVNLLQNKLNPSGQLQQLGNNRQVQGQQGVLLNNIQFQGQNQLVPTKQQLVQLQNNKALLQQVGQPQNVQLQGQNQLKLVQLKQNRIVPNQQQLLQLQKNKLQQQQIVLPQNQIQPTQQQLIERLQNNQLRLLQTKQAQNQGLQQNNRLGGVAFVTSTPSPFVVSTQPQNLGQIVVNRGGSSIGTQSAARGGTAAFGTSTPLPFVGSTQAGFNPEQSYFDQDAVTKVRGQIEAANAEIRRLQAGGDAGAQVGGRFSNGQFLFNGGSQGRGQVSPTVAPQVQFNQNRVVPTQQQLLQLQRNQVQQQQVVLPQNQVQPTQQQLIERFQNNQVRLQQAKQAQNPVLQQNSRLGGVQFVTSTQSPFIVSTQPQNLGQIVVNRGGSSIGAQSAARGGTAAFGTSTPLPFAGSTQAGFDQGQSYFDQEALSKVRGQIEAANAEIRRLQAGGDGGAQFGGNFNNGQFILNGGNQGSSTVAPQIQLNQNRVVPTQQQLLQLQRNQVQQQQVVLPQNQIQPTQQQLIKRLQNNQLRLQQAKQAQSQVLQQNGQLGGVQFVTSTQSPFIASTQPQSLAQIVVNQGGSSIGAQSATGGGTAAFGTSTPLPFAGSTQAGFNPEQYFDQEALSKVRGQIEAANAEIRRLQAGGDAGAQVGGSFNRGQFIIDGASQGRGQVVSSTVAPALDSNNALNLKQLDPEARARLLALLSANTNAQDINRLKKL